MRVSVNDYLNNYPLDKIGMPDWTHLGVTSKKTVKLDWDSIYIDHKSNASKVEAHKTGEIEALRISFINGVETTECPPAVIYRGDKCDKPYQLIYGFGRSEALRDRGLKTKSWNFTLLEGTEDGIEDVQAAENEGLPKRLNEKADMLKFLVAKVKSGKIKPTEDAIRKKAFKVYVGQHPNTINLVVQQVIESVGIPQPYELYTSTAKISDWLDNHSKTDYAIDGKYDKNLDMYGMTQKEGYMYRSFMYAIARYRKTGKKTYMIFHCDAPTGKATLLKKRLAIIESFNQHLLDFQSIGVDPSNVPLIIMGFLPQEKDVEDWKKLITPDEIKASLPFNKILNAP